MVNEPYKFPSVKWSC